MSNKNTIQDELRTMLEGNDEALELVEALTDEIVDLKQELMDEKDSVARLTTDNEELNEAMGGYSAVFLGLDTLHYRLEQGNLKVQLQLEHWINLVKQQNGAGVIMPG